MSSHDSHVMSIPYKGQVSPTIFQVYVYMTLLFKQSSHLFWVCKNPNTPLVEIPAGVETSRDSLSFLPRPKIIPVTVTWRHGTWLCWNQQVMWASPCRGSAVPLVFWRWGCWWWRRVFDAWGWDGFTVGRCGVGYGGGLYELFITRSILGDLGTIVTNHFTKWDGYSKVGMVKVLYSKIS